MEKIELELDRLAEVTAAEMTPAMLSRRAWLLESLAAQTKSPGDFQKALDAYDSALAATTPDAAILRHAARLAWALGERARALEYVHRSVRINPDSRRLLFQMYYSLRHRPEAINGLAAFERGLDEGKRGRLNAAIASFSESISLSPTFERAYYWLGMTYLKRGERIRPLRFMPDIEHARRAFEKSNDLSYGHPLSLFGLAYCQLHLGAFKAAIETASRCLEVDPHFGRARRIRASAIWRQYIRILLRLEWKKAHAVLLRITDDFLNQDDVDKTPYGQFCDKHGEPKEQEDRILLYELPAPQQSDEQSATTPPGTAVPHLEE